MENSDGSVINKRRTEIRSRIRRGEIEQYFQRRRQEFVQWGQAVPEHLRKLLATPEDRITYVDNIVAKLNNTDINAWSTIFQQIKIALPYFRHCCWPWVGYEGRVVKALYQGFISQSGNGSAKREIVSILTELMSCQQQKDEFIATGIYYFSLEQDVTNYLKEARLPTLSLQPFLHFFACLARSKSGIRRKLFEIGAEEYLLSYGRELLQSQLACDQKECHNFMGMCADFTCPFRDGRRNTISLNFIEPLLSIVVELLQRRGEESTINEGLYAICCISTVATAPTLPIFATRRFIRIIIEHSKVGKFQSNALTILHILSRSDNKDICQLLFEEGVLDVFLEISHQEPTRISHVMILNSLMLLGVEEVEIRRIVEHPVWAVVMEGLSSANLIIKREAFQCVLNIYLNADPPALKKSISDKRMVDIVMANLSNFRDGDKEVLHGALKLLKRYIQAMIEEKNIRALLFLDSVYRLDALLGEMMIDSPNDQVRTEAEAISQIYSAGIMEDCGSV